MAQVRHRGCKVWILGILLFSAVSQAADHPARDYPISGYPWLSNDRPLPPTLLGVYTTSPSDALSNTLSEGHQAENLEGFVWVIRNSSVQHTRQYAALRAKDSGSSAIRPLLEVARDPNALGREEAIVALGLLGEQASLTTGDVFDFAVENQTLAPAAIWSLGEFGAAAVPYLIRALDVPSFRAERSDAIQALGKIRGDPQVVLPALTVALNDPETYTPAAEAIGALATRLQDEQEIRAIELLEAAVNALRSPPHAALPLLEPDPFDKNAGRQTRTTGLSVGLGIDSPLSRTERSVAALRLKRDLELRSWQAAVLQWVKNHPTQVAPVAGFPTLLCIWFALLMVKPLWLLTMDDAVSGIEVEISWPAKMKLALRNVCLLSLFSERSRVLDAWIAERHETARQNFDSKSTVQARTVHVDLPVRIDGRVVSTVKPEDIRWLFQRRRVCLVITGEGGVGKTSFAYQLVRWAMSDDPVETLTPGHPMLPILLEGEFHAATVGKHGVLVDAVRGELRALVGEAEPLSEHFVVKLLTDQRLLVIVDGLSERTTADRAHVRPGDPDWVLNALIVTSRQQEQLDEVPRSVLEPLRIQGDRLASFVEAYLTRSGHRESFPDTEFFEACSQLAAIVGPGEVTPLLARLYLDLLIRNKERVAGERVLVPRFKDVPEMILTYVNELNRMAREGDPDDRQVHATAKKIAWQCLKDTLRPLPADRTSILAALECAEPERVLDYLEFRINLLQTVGAAKTQLRFSHDTIAEYFAALHVLERFDGDAAAWRELIERMESTAPLDTIKGFLRALRDCLATAPHSSAIDHAATEVARLLKLVQEPERSARLPEAVLYSGT